MEMLQLAYKAILALVCVCTLAGALKEKSLAGAIGLGIVSMPLLLRLLSVK